jgi:hypothetical protein
MTLLLVIIGLLVLIFINRSILKVFKYYTLPVNARCSTEVVNYKLSKLKDNINKLK